MYKGTTFWEIFNLQAASVEHQLEKITTLGVFIIGLFAPYLYPMTSEALYDSDAGKQSDVQTGMDVQTVPFYLSFDNFVHFYKTRQALRI